MALSPKDIVYNLENAMSYGHTCYRQRSARLVFVRHKESGKLICLWPGGGALDYQIGKAGAPGKERAIFYDPVHQEVYSLDELIFEECEMKDMHRALLAAQGRYATRQLLETTRTCVNAAFCASRERIQQIIPKDIADEFAKKKEMAWRMRMMKWRMKKMTQRGTKKKKKKNHAAEETLL